MISFKSSNNVKRKHVTLTIANKLKVIERLDSGVPGTEIATEFGISRQTVCDIKRHKEKILEYATKFNVTSSSNRQTLRKSKDALLDDVLREWYLEQKSSGVEIRGADLQAAAQRFSEKYGVKNFSASAGWLYRFRQRHNIATNKICADKVCNYSETSETFRSKLDAIMSTSGLGHLQIYNADETLLRWRFLPESMNVSTGTVSESKTKIGVFLCTNAAGSHRLKPVILGKKNETSDLAGYRCPLPVTYYNTGSACFSPDLLKYWFHKHFVPEVGRYQKEILHFNDDQIKAILILGNAHKHSSIQNLLSANGKIRCITLPANLSFSHQPMHQGIFTICKRMYRKKLIEEVAVVLHNNERARTSEKMIENIKVYDIKSAIFNWSNSWKEVPMKILINSWKKLFQDCDSEVDLKGFEPENYLEVFRASGECRVTEENIRIWLEMEEENVQFDNINVDENTDDMLQVASDEAQQNAKDNNTDAPMDHAVELNAARIAIDTVVNFVGSSTNIELQSYYEQMRSLKEIVIRAQLRRAQTSTNQLKIKEEPLNSEVGNACPTFVDVDNNFEDFKVTPFDCVVKREDEEYDDD